MHKSVATIDSPEFINLQPLDINPLMSKCEIKVLYLGENRNHSYITKEVAADMAKTLRGAPIVGYFREEKEDFADHGHRVILDDEGVKFECLTKPYGFVSPDAQVWFQTFEDEDEFGNTIEREYLMTTGYLWTGQFEECQVAVSEGRPQSMELDEQTLDGNWSTNVKTGMDFFIINDAIFSKLCILGDDVEPCFEGSSVKAPEVSTSFTKVDESFRNTLYTMMQDLQFALEGGRNMEEIENVVTNEESLVEEPIVETPVEEEAPVAAEEEIPVAEEETEVEAEEAGEEIVTEEVIEEPVVEEVAVEVESIPAETANENSEITNENDDNSEKSHSKKIEDSLERNFTLEDYLELQNKYAALEEENAKLVEFKLQVENEKKDALINSFYMLSDEDKAEVIENKANYSLDEIEAKLSVICVRKKVSFDLEDENKEEQPITTFSLGNLENEAVPAWISACKNIQSKNK
jgi:hypothetical protein